MGSGSRSPGRYSISGMYEYDDMNQSVKSNKNQLKNEQAVTWSNFVKQLADTESRWNKAKQNIEIQKLNNSQGKLEIVSWILQLLLSLPKRGICKNQQSEIDEEKQETTFWIDLAPLIRPVLNIIMIMNGQHPLYRVLAFQLGQMIQRWTECHEISGQQHLQQSTASKSSLFFDSNELNSLSNNTQHPCHSLRGFPYGQIRKFITQIGMDKVDDDFDDEDDDEDKEESDVNMTLPHAVQLLELKAEMLHACKVRQNIIQQRKNLKYDTLDKTKLQINQDIEQIEQITD
ncbi:MAG: hypothetical protein EZS28_038577, partial [Streblomastix strix]